jgi:4'-phosphopantetheinyl transferase EntD
LFHDLSALSGEVEVNVAVRANTGTGTECDITIGLPGQPPLAKFNRLCHRRIALPQGWKPLVVSAGTAFLTEEMTSVTEELPQSSMWSAARLREDVQIDDAMLFWCADYLLSEGEQEFFWQLRHARRRREWMLGRIALKDAVRRLAAAYGVPPICPAEIETHQQPDGSPGIGSVTVELLGWRPIVSLAHKAGVAIAIAGHPDAARAVGIDLETVEVREEGFDSFALTANELAGLANSSPDQANRAIAKIWCAKEAAGKALGIGLSNNPKSLETIAADAQTSNRILVRRSDARSASEFCAYVFSDGEEVFAVCPIE